MSSSSEEIEMSVDLPEANIMIAGSRVQVRVHRSVLVLNSDFFREVLTQHPPAACDSDSPPILRLTLGDSDIVHYSNAIYGVNGYEILSNTIERNELILLQRLCVRQKAGVRHIGLFGLQHHCIQEHPAA